MLRLAHILIAWRGAADSTDRFRAGVASYSTRELRWRLTVQAIRGEEMTGDMCRANGVIAVAARCELASRLQRSGVPTVLIRPEAPAELAPCVVQDDPAVGRLAAEHVLQCGFRHFAYCGTAGASIHVLNDLRRAGFAEAVGKAGFSCALLNPPLDWPDVHWTGSLDHLSRWLRSLPRPVAILAFNDEVARRLADVCELLGLHIPSQVAIVGVDNHVFACQQPPVTLTSVDMNLERMGFEAARILADLLAGRPVPAEPVVVPVRGIVERESTQAMNFDDPEVSAALRVIRLRACDGMNVEQLMDEMRLSRRSLERRFRETLGRSINDEIRRVRMERARVLVLETDMPLIDVAVRVGHVSLPYFVQAFKQTFGIPPGAYRRENRRP